MTLRYINDSAKEGSKIDKEKVLNEVDDHSNRLIKAITNMQDVSVKKAETLKPWYDETLLKELKELVEKVETESTDGDQFEQVNEQILELKFNCDQMLDCRDHVSFIKKRCHKHILIMKYHIYGIHIKKTLSQHKIEPMKYISKNYQKDLLE